MLRSILNVVVAGTVALGIVIGATDARSEAIRNITPQKAARLLQQNPGITLLDIRTPREYRAGHISGAMNINFYSKRFRQNLSKLDRNKPYLVHCRTGVRSGRALRLFRELGFKNVAHMNRGLRAWKRAGLKTVKP